MIKNYLKTAINNLLGDKLYSGINILGLAFGLAATILIALYVLDETSYDRQWRNVDRIYRVNQHIFSTGSGFSPTAGTALPVMPALQRFFRMRSRPARACCRSTVKFAWASGGSRKRLRGWTPVSWRCSSSNSLRETWRMRCRILPT
jgi:putative ABC transport system permease protein